jgi:signal peptidase
MRGTRYLRLALEGAVAVVVVSLLLGSLLGQPVGLGYVETGSMEPTLEPGDGFVAVPTPLAGSVGEGDVVTFRAQTLQGGGLTTHRIVGRTEEGYLTHGDANPFLDQQSGEPPVERSRIVAVALRIDGDVVVLPALGTVVTESQDLLVSVGVALGVGRNPGRLGTILFAVLGAAYLLDEGLEPPDEERPAERRPVRDSGLSAERLLALGVAVVLVVTTLSMVLPGGAVAISYDSVGPGEASQGGIVAGTSKPVPVELSNGGIVPMVAVLDTPDGASLSDEMVVLGPRDSTTVNVTITAPTERGAYEQQVVQRRYLGILPVSIVRTLHDVHRWVAIAAIDAFLGATLLVSGRLLLGRGRIRLRSERSVPVTTSVRRVIRHLY